MAKSSPYVASCWVYSIVSHSIQKPTGTQLRDQLLHKRPNCTKKTRSQFVE